MAGVYLYIPWSHKFRDFWLSVASGVSKNLGGAEAGPKMVPSVRMMLGPRVQSEMSP